jgi:hypothetical protein
MTSILTKVTLAAAVILGGLIGTQSVASAHGGGYGYGYGYHPHYPVWHNTSHYDYHPGYFTPHGNHYHYVPGHYDYHQTGHWHW